MTGDSTFYIIMRAGVRLRQRHREDSGSPVLAPEWGLHRRFLYESVHDANDILVGWGLHRRFLYESVHDANDILVGWGLHRRFLYESVHDANDILVGSELHRLTRAGLFS
jgi:pyruvate/2-oxoacid:ferredoxin oxidoreductase alpha subunit